MEKIRILLAGDSLMEQHQLSQQLSRQPDFEVLAVAHHGLEAVQQAIRLRPDALVCDLTISQCDGFEVLQRLQEAALSTKVILTATVAREEYISMAIALGASYFLIKPLDVPLLARRLRQVCARPAETFETPPDRDDASLVREQTGRYIGRILMQLCISPHLDGHRFLRAAILLAVDDAALPDSMGQRLYPAVAAQFDTTPSRVERSIRFAIRRAWAYGGAPAYAKLLGRSMSAPPKPSNREFIASLAERVRIRSKSDT